MRHMQLSHNSIILITNALTHIKQTAQSYTQQALNKDVDKSVSLSSFPRYWRYVLNCLAFATVVLTTMKAVRSCIRDVRKDGEEDDWKKKTRDRGGWKRLYQMRRRRSCGQPLAPDKVKKWKREVPSFSSFNR